MSDSPIEVVGHWLQNLLDPEVINSVVASDATYVSLNTENPERVLPGGTPRGFPVRHTGIAVSCPGGPSGPRWPGW
jgi:hypothetical protein